jgi:glycerol-3-phosphate acyltransferase PlsY
MNAIAPLLFGYLLGSLPFAVIVSRIFGLPDPRTVGSKNPGATNVLRSGNKLAAVLTLLGDALKGWLAMLLAGLFGADGTGIALAGLAAFLGHVFPLFLKFKGGKGVATGLGILLVISWKAALAAAVIWIALAAVFRYSSLASLVAATAAPVILWFVGTPHEALLFAALAALTFFMHRANIARLMQGTESKIGQKAGAPREA